MDSVAIRWSLRLVARGQRDGATVSMVVAPGGQPHRVLEVCGLAHYLQVADGASA